MLGDFKIRLALLAQLCDMSTLSSSKDPWHNDVKQLRKLLSHQPISYNLLCFAWQTIFYVGFLNRPIQSTCPSGTLSCSWLRWNSFLAFKCPQQGQNRKETEFHIIFLGKHIHEYIISVGAVIWTECHMAWLA